MFCFKVSFKVGKHENQCTSSTLVFKKLLMQAASKQTPTVTSCSLLRGFSSNRRSALNGWFWKNCGNFCWEKERNIWKIVKLLFLPSWGKCKPAANLRQNLERKLDHLPEIPKGKKPLLVPGIKLSTFACPGCMLDYNTFKDSTGFWNL